MPSNSTLSTLVVSTPHRLAYGIPLILISIPLLLAGTFLTLDRSRSFSPSHEVPPLPGAFDHAKRKWRALFGLRGGVGGLASGYVFGRKSKHRSHAPSYNLIYLILPSPIIHVPISLDTRDILFSASDFPIVLRRMDLIFYPNNNPWRALSILCPSLLISMWRVRA